MDATSAWAYRTSVCWYSFDLNLKTRQSVLGLTPRMAFTCHHWGCIFIGRQLPTGLGNEIPRCGLATCAYLRRYLGAFINTDTMFLFGNRRALLTLWQSTLQGHVDATRARLGMTNGEAKLQVPSKVHTVQYALQIVQRGRRGYDKFTSIIAVMQYNSFQLL